MHKQGAFVINYLETNSFDPYYNLSFEESVFRRFDGKSYFMLWQNEPSVIVGRNQNTENEVDLKYAEKQGIKVVKRMTGGGSVYHDLGNLNYSFITDFKTMNDSQDELLSFFTKPVIEALKTLGINAYLSDTNDILAEGCKISGTAQYAQGSRILFHGTLLFDTDLSILDKVLLSNKHPGVFSSNHRNVCNIKSLLKDKNLTINEFKELIKRSVINY